MITRKWKYLGKKLLNKTLPCRNVFRNHGYIKDARVVADKNTSLADEPVALKISGLQAFQKITLHASSRLPNNSLFESFSHFVADDSGCVTLDHNHSHGGNYEGIDRMGPISQLVPSSSNERKYERFMVKDPMVPFSIDFRISDSFHDSLESITNEGLLNNPPNLSISRTYASPGVQEINIWEGRVRATLYVPAGDGPFPGVVSMSGGFPGAIKFKGALLASHGFAALCLKYFGEDDLTPEFMNVDISYIEEACHFLKSHPKVDGRNGVGIIANCFGGLIGLATASLVPDGLIRCVTSINGWPFIFGKFQYGSRRWKTSKNFKKIIRKDEDGITHWYHDYIGDAKSAEFAEKDFFPFQKRHNTSYLFVTAGDDTYVPCHQVLKPVQTKLELANHPDFQILHYPKAGHLIEHSYHPHTDIAWTMGEPHMVGGTQPYHGKAQEDSWPKILDFTYKRLVSR